jgi:uncharacterized protein with von Willebrand factor type A (vWA) domain
LAYLSEVLEHFDYRDSKWIQEQLNPYKANHLKEDGIKIFLEWRKGQTYYDLYKSVKEKEVKPLQDKFDKEEKDLKTEKAKTATLQKQVENEKEKFVNKQKELDRVNSTLTSYQKFVESLIKNRRDELLKLNNQAKNKLQANSEWLETFYRAQKEIDRNSNNTFAQEQVGKSYNILIQSITDDEINNSLTKQREIWQLEKQLVDLNIYEERYEAKVETLPKYND